jgi:CheY-like chemotaxis protein
MTGVYGSARTNGVTKAVLIVEDEPVARRALSALLRGAGYTPHAASSAEEALKLLGDGCQPRIALIDVDLPGMNGFELVRELRTIHPSIVPILVTATDGERIDKFRQGSSVSFMRKPIDVDDLLSLLEQGHAGQPVH